MKNFNDRYRDILSKIKIFEDALDEMESADISTGRALRDELTSLKITKKQIETSVI